MLSAEAALSWCSGAFQWDSVLVAFIVSLAPFFLSVTFTVCPACPQFNARPRIVSDTVSFLCPLTFLSPLWPACRPAGLSSTSLPRSLPPLCPLFIRSSTSFILVSYRFLPHAVASSPCVSLAPHLCSPPLWYLCSLQHCQVNCPQKRDPLCPVSAPTADGLVTGCRALHSPFM